MTDKQLLEIYMYGFKNELNSAYNEDLVLSAYRLGKIHAIVGDDVSSSDDLNEGEIIKQIYDSNNSSK